MLVNPVPCLKSPAVKKDRYTTYPDLSQLERGQTDIKESSYIVVSVIQCVSMYPAVRVITHNTSISHLSCRNIHTIACNNLVPPCVANRRKCARTAVRGTPRVHHLYRQGLFRPEFEVFLGDKNILSVLDSVHFFVRESLPMGQAQRPSGGVALPFVWLLVGMVIQSHKRSYRGLTNAAYYFFVLLFASLVALGRSQCRIVECSSQYAQESTHLTSQTRQACKAVIRFKDCVDGIVPSTCRGDLTYHSTMTIIPDLMRNNCEGVNTVTPENSPRTSTEYNTCRYKGSNSFRHCGLFGDPHLRTFGDTFLTCKAPGAWPLVFNEYLAVQVTNVPLTHGQGATATSKLIVIIKESKPCTEKKTYEVRSGSLPNTFNDGSRRSGTVSITTKVPGEHIEIHIKHIATIIIVRQLGKYITFAIRMPEELIRSRGVNDIQLCVKGCPQSQTIAYADFLVQTRIEGKSSEGLSVKDNFVLVRDNAVSKCRKAAVIDVYLDSCVFDLITTGDSNFTKAAQSALSDMKLLNPEASSLLRNRTSVFEQDNVVWRLIYGNAAPSRTITRWTRFYELMVVFALGIFIHYL